MGLTQRALRRRLPLVALPLLLFVALWQGGGLLDVFIAAAVPATLLSALVLRLGKQRDAGAEPVAGSQLQPPARAPESVTPPMGGAESPTTRRDRSERRLVEPRAAPRIVLGTVVAAPPQPLLVVPGQRFDLDASELGRHLTVLGTTGSGKTTTVCRLIDGALAAGWPVAVVDAKGGGLVAAVRSLGERYTVPVRIWLPGVPESWTYDVCAGEPAAVANRLIGTFTYGPEGSVYKHISQGVLPLVVRALQQQGGACDLDAIRTHLDPPRLIGLARRVTDRTLKAELLGAVDGVLHKQALAGLAGRLGALRHGAFGPWLLPSERTLDLDQALSHPGITYLGLPATGASEDVDLVGRVFFQDLKQVAYRRMRSLRAEQPNQPSAERSAAGPALLVIDEFATLREADQLIDLLLQAREADLAVVVSSQYVPRSTALRQSVLGAGTVAWHQIGSAEDADLLARTLGTRATVEVTRQIQDTPPVDASAPGTRSLIRPARVFLTSPDDLRRLPVGQAVVCVRHGRQRIATVQIDHP